MTTLKVGGVPEHFNLPWHMAIEAGAFEERNINVKWYEQHGGTGAMTKALRNRELDIAILLTEGIIADIVNGSDAKLIQQYVRSPLIWGIHCLSGSKYNNASEIKDARFAISRNGSGSHIMAYVFAEQQGWKPQDLNFKVVGNFDGAIEAFKKDEADILLWEKYTTKPYVDGGILKRIGETITPWSCFMIAANADALKEKRKAISDCLSVIRRYCEHFMHIENATELVSERYKIDLIDAKAWYRQTGWSINNYIPKKMLQDVMRTLKSVKVIEEQIPVENTVDEMLWFDRLVV